MSVSFFFVDGRDSNRFSPFFKKLLMELQFFCDNVPVQHSPEMLEEQICNNNDSRSFLITLVQSYGEDYCEIAERLRETGTDLDDLVEFDDTDFDELGVGKPSVRNQLKGLVKLAIPEITKKKIACAHWKPEQVRDHLLQFGTFCEAFAEALFQKGIVGYVLFSTHPETFLQDYAEHFTEKRDGETLPIGGLRRRNVLRKLHRLYEPEISQEEEEEVAGAQADYNYPKTNDNKWAAVLPVFRDRHPGDALEEARMLEKELQHLAGYNLWLCEGRKSSESSPRSILEKDIHDFNAWFATRKESKDIDGVFVFIIAHGYTEGGKTRLILEDCNSLEVESWLTGTLAGTNFPVICCIGSCRARLDAIGDGSHQELKAPTLDVQRNIYLSWSAAMGEYAMDGTFVEQWRLAIAYEFMQNHVGTVAENILFRCKNGKNYSGLDPGKGKCRAGVWVQQGHLGPKKIIQQSSQALMKKCIYFAKRALKKRDLEMNDLESWQSCGMLQGENIAIEDGDAIAVVCCHKGTKTMQGILFRKQDESPLQELVMALNQVKITEKTPKRKCNSIEAFLDTTEQI